MNKKIIVMTASILFLNTTTECTFKNSLATNIRLICNAHKCLPLQAKRPAYLETKQKNNSIASALAACVTEKLELEKEAELKRSALRIKHAEQQQEKIKTPTLKTISTETPTTSRQTYKTSNRVPSWNVAK